jgi:hypothetical protein
LEYDGGNRTNHKRSVGKKRNIAARKKRLKHGTILKEGTKERQEERAEK